VLEMEKDLPEFEEGGLSSKKRDRRRRKDEEVNVGDGRWWKRNECEN